MVFVESADKYHESGFAGHLYGLGAERVGNLGGDYIGVAIHRAARHVALGVLDFVAVEVSESVERSYDILRFEFRRAASGHEVAGGVLAHHKNLAIAVGVDGEQGGLLFGYGSVFEQYDTLVANLLGHGIVFGSGYGAIGLLTIGGRAEIKAQQTAHLVVESRHGHFALLEHGEIRVGKVIVVGGKLAFRGQAVGVGAHLEVKTVECASRVSCAPPQSVMTTPSNCQSSLRILLRISSL